MKLETQQIPNPKVLIYKIQKLLNAYENGEIHAEKMPEDERPELKLDSEELVRYLTFPMALNNQRNSYTLWENANKLYHDPVRSYLFDPLKTILKPWETIQEDLLYYKVALQPNKHVNTWFTLSKTFGDEYGGLIKNLFDKSDYNIGTILETIQTTHKKGFPYLSGNKIAHYWLYVLTQYTSLPFNNLSALSVAPDTHVIQASIKLGVISEVLPPQRVATIWKDLLISTNIEQISVHTPLWLWSRSGFKFQL